MKKKIIVITGPTASGKSSIALEAAKAAQGSIICMDSMQIYRHMDIGTAKPTAAEQEQVPHYLFDHVSPFDAYSVAQYKEDAAPLMQTISNPFFVGGTGLYLNAITTDMNFANDRGNDEIRNKYQRICDEEGKQHLHDLLEEVDPPTAARLHINDTRRVIRALEVYELTGVPFSEQQDAVHEDPDHEFIIFAPLWDRDILYDRINQRVDMMIHEGLVNEIRMLLDMGLTGSEQSMKGIGYKELINALHGECSIDEAIALIKQKSRNYAKRQMTWFRRDERIRWIDMKENNVDSAKEIVLKTIL